MNKRIFLIICLLFTFTVSSLSYSANKTTTARYNNLLKQAKAGDAKAMFLVARMIERGKGTRKDINKASKWYQRSASQNYAAANARLGKLYLEGIAVNKNPKKAFSLLNLAAIQGIPVAQFNLAILYELGIGTERDLPEAITWFDKAAKGGYFSARLKSNELKKQIGIANTAISSADLPSIQATNDELEIPVTIAVKKIKLPVPTTSKTTPQLSKPKIANNEIKPALTENLAQTETTTKKQQNDDSEELALLSNGFERDEIPQANIVKTPSTNDLDNIDPNKRQQIKQALLTLLTGRWFDKNRPATFLPSPKAQCNIINTIELKCISRQLQRRTDNETIIYKTLGKVSNINNHGNFVIQYQNNIVRVIIDKKTTIGGKKFISKVKAGLQKKIHQLNCQYKDKSNLVCIKDNSEKYDFQNRAIIN